MNWWSWKRKILKNTKEEWNKHINDLSEFCFRLYDACWVPDSICDFEWWWTFGKKCYECSVKWVFYLEKRKIPENKKVLFMTDEECNNYLKDCHKRVAEEQLDLICVCPWRGISVSADDNESDDLDNE